MKFTSLLTIFLSTFSALIAFNVVGAENKGIGPFEEVKIDAKVDEKLAEKGKSIFQTKCSACHKINERYVGPALKGITSRRTPEWTMNMIMNPAEMLEKDETAKDLLGEFSIPMTFQNVTKEDTRAIYEYFRYEDSSKEGSTEKPKKETTPKKDSKKSKK